MLELRIDPNSHTPPSAQLVERVLDAVAGGGIGVGERLPSVRRAAVAAMVNPNTVQKAWRELEVLGVVRARNGSGVVVAEDGPRIAGELRGAATLGRFEAAARAALTSGHGVEELAVLLDAVAADHVARADAEVAGGRTDA